jgi:hypothetical protein
VLSYFLATALSKKKIRKQILNRGLQVTDWLTTACGRVNRISSISMTTTGFKYPCFIHSDCHMDECFEWQKEKGELSFTVELINNNRHYKPCSYGAVSRFLIICQQICIPQTQDTRAIQDTYPSVVLRANYIFNFSRTTSETFFHVPQSTLNKVKYYI